MSTHDNAPPPAEWSTEPRPCPIPCSLCVLEDVTVPANIELGTE